LSAEIDFAPNSESATPEPRVIIDAKPAKRVRITPMDETDAAMAMRMQAEEAAQGGFGGLGEA